MFSMAPIEQHPLEPSTKTSPPAFNLFKADFALRLLLAVAALAAPVIIVTGNQTFILDIPLTNIPLITLKAKYNYSPAFIYVVVALVIALVYSLLTAVVSFLSISKPSPPNKLLLRLAVLDLLMFGVVVSAAGAGISVGYIGMKGNTHTGWMQICKIYGNFCRHIEISLVLSLIAAKVLIVLVILSMYSLYRRSS